MSQIIFSHAYDDIISIENLLEAWKEFIRGKKSRKDVQEFRRNLMSNVISLHDDLVSKEYLHSSYEAFNISDPKPRNIHKAKVRDRLLHHAFYRFLYPLFDRTFTVDSYSCRLGKGTHKAMNRFRTFSNKVTKNHTKTAWVLKCDIRKFFASIDQSVLSGILEKYTTDKDILWLLERIIQSFDSGTAGKGLPLGNLTSQLLVNIYMNEFDQFMKHCLKVKYYTRYADDFVIMSQDKDWLIKLTTKIGDFLEARLKLSLHPNKVFIKTLASGVDFLGWVHFPDHKVLRTVTKRRMFKKLRDSDKLEIIQSYRGLLSQGSACKLRSMVK